VSIRRETRLSEKEKSSLEKKMLEYLPHCPICKSNLGYEFSTGIRTFFESYAFDAQAKCKQCGAIWLVGGQALRLVQVSKDGAGRSFFGKVYSYNFWQKLSTKEVETEQKPLTIEKKKKEEGRKKVTEILQPKPFREKSKTGRPIVFFTLVVLFIMGLIGGGIRLSNDLNLYEVAKGTLLETTLYDIFVIDIVTFLVQIVLFVCLLAIANWVAVDEESIIDLKNQVEKLQREKSKNN
jgi:hypothetical protein